ncbi:MAG: aminotransferase class I/II-fold pyridoxal phosphate-dependent enzyme [Clostridia bacterium]
MDEDYKKRTLEDILMHYGEDSGDFLGAVTVPIFQTSLFSRKGGGTPYHYTRVNNPTLEVAEKKIALMEKGEKGLLFSSGMAALTASAMHVLRPGDHVVCVKNAYISMAYFFSTYLKERMQLETSFFDADDFEGYEAAVRDNTALVYLETCVSNVFKIPDIQRICAHAKQRGITVMVDNTYSTPVFCNPIPLGADLVAHSCSKYIGGHSDLIGGVLVGREEVMKKIQNGERSLFGACMDPHQAWLVTRSLRTLALRMERHMQNGIAVARYLESHGKIHKVIHPALESHPQHMFSRTIMSGYPGVFAFVPEGGQRTGEKLYDALAIPEKGPSWGGYDTIMNTPGFGMDEETARERGMIPGQMRISIGLENPETLIMDFEQALAKI